MCDRPTDRRTGRRTDGSLLVFAQLHNHLLVFT